MCEDDKVQRCFETVVAHLECRGICFGRADNGPVLFVPLACRKATYFCTVDVSDAILRVYATVGCHAPEQKRAVAAELLNRINWRLVVGNFEMDVADGEIRYRTTLDARGGELTDEMVECTIRTNLTTIDRFYPAIMTLLWNDLSAEDALALVEGNSVEGDSSE